MNVILADTVIHQDAEGRFSLNDMHKASGGAAKHAPSKFWRQDSVKEMADALNWTKSSSLEPLVTTPGRLGGTYACKELVYAYAMWVSPEFAIHVIRTFDAIVTGRTAESLWIHMVDVFQVVQDIHWAKKTVRRRAEVSALPAAALPRLRQALKNPDHSEYLIVADAPGTDAFCRADKVCAAAELAFSQVYGISTGAAAYNHTGFSAEDFVELRRKSLDLFSTSLEHVLSLIKTAPAVARAPGATKAAAQLLIS